MPLDHVEKKAPSPEMVHVQFLEFADPQFESDLSAEFFIAEAIHKLS